MEVLVEQDRLARVFAGCLLGGAVGDAVGLAVEGVGPRRAARLFPDLDGPRLLGRRGMISDDTEHALFTARALARSGDDAEKFALELRGELKLWLLGLPAGAGAATLKAAARAWRGVAPESCGVDSAGNGPCMRAPIIGAWAAADDALLCRLNRASSRLSHTDPRAEAGSLAVAMATRDAAQGIEPRESAARIVGGAGAWMHAASTSGVQELLQSVKCAADSAHAGEETWEFARSIVGDSFEAKGVSGFVSHTVPVALQAAWRGPDARESVLSAVRCGGDADSTAAIAGAIRGARDGRDGVPGEWISALAEWPRGARFIEDAAQVLASAKIGGADVEWPRANPAAIAARNVLFGAVVLAHGFRRLAPPY